MSAVIALVGLGIATALVLYLCISRWPVAALAAWLATEPYAMAVFGHLTRTVAATVPRSSSAARIAELVSDVLTWDHLVVGTFLLVLAVAIVRGRRPRPQLLALDALMASFAVLLLASVVFLAHNKDHALRTAGDAFIIPFLVAFIARALVTDLRALRTVIAGVSVLGCLLVGHGLIERAAAMDALHRVQGPFQNKGLLGAVLVVVFVALLALVRDRQFLDGARRWIRGAYEIALHAIPAVLFFSFSRGAWLAFFFAMGLLLARAHGLLSPRRLGGIAAASTGLIGIWGVSLLGEEVAARWPAPGEAKRVPAVQEVVERHVTNVGTVQYRTRAWRLLLPGIGDRPLSGLGLGNSVDFLAKERVRSRPNKTARKTARNAHSAYLSILFEAGLSGFICFLGIQAVIIRRGIALARAAADEQLRFLGLILLALTIAYSIPGITANTFFRPTVGNFLYYALVGAVLALGARPAAAHAVGEAGRPPCGAA